jgi:hypothetical protein
MWYQAPEKMDDGGVVASAAIPAVRRRKRKAVALMKAIDHTCSLACGPVALAMSVRSMPETMSGFTHREMEKAPPPLAGSQAPNKMRPLTPSKRAAPAW